MSISLPFIQRPVATTLLTIDLGLSGAVAYNFLPVSPLPQVDFPSIVVGAGLPGASPDTMASSVATPLERQFGRIAGLNEMTSSSSLGSTNITLQFDLNRSIDGAARDVEAGINAARGQLPANLPQNPTWRKINPADPPVLQLGVTSSTKTPGELYDAASTILAQKISQVNGVGQVSVGGSAALSVRVDVNPTLLNSFGLGMEDVRTVLMDANVNHPKGSLQNSYRTWELNTTDQLRKADQYAPLIIAYKNGAPVKVSDVAAVTDSVSDIRNAGFANGKRAVIVNVFRLPGANIIDTVDRVRAVLPQLVYDIPAAIDVSVISDRTVTIRASVKDVQRTMMISISLVVMVVFLFLRSWRTTLIPIVVVPTSLVATFGLLYVFGYSIDNLSLMALTIATGFVVDDAIVVIENITRHIEAGMAPMAAAIHGVTEIGFTVVSISISLIAVFIPILLMAGLVGRLFREFAITLSITILISLAISLTTTPTMCSRLLRRPDHEPRGVIYWLRKGYEKCLGWVMEHQPMTLLVALTTIAVTVYLYVIVPKGFFPQQDTGRLTGQIFADQASSFQAMQSRVAQVVDVVMQDPAVDAVNAYVGGGNGYNKASIQVGLKPLAERKTNSDAVIGRLRPKLNRIAGASVYLQSVQDLRIGGRMTGAQYQYTLQSDNTQDLNHWAPLVLAKLRSLPELADVNTDQQDKGLEASLLIDRPTAARLGVSPQVIDDTLYDAFGQREVSIMYTQMNQYFVVLEVDPRFWQDPDSLQYLYVPGNNDVQVPLSAVTHYVSDNTPLAVNHNGQFPSVTISFNLPLGISLSEAVPVIEDAEREIGMPSNVTGLFQGTAQAFQESISNEPVLIVAALVAVYIVLGMLYEDLIHPVTILSTLPSAGVGALLALLVSHDELNVIALIGIILLIGIVQKNAIMMIDFAIAAARNEGLSTEKAIFQACLLRFRPIIMTTTAAMLSSLPLALGQGEGAELRRPLGIAILGGLAFSQMLTLFTTPVVYLYMDRLRVRLSLLRRKTVYTGASNPSEA
jgi:multidrug efflux pump